MSYVFVWGLGPGARSRESRFSGLRPWDQSSLGGGVRLQDQIGGDFLVLYRVILRGGLQVRLTNPVVASALGLTAEKDLGLRIWVLGLRFQGLCFIDQALGNKVQELIRADPVAISEHIPESATDPLD